MTSTTTGLHPDHKADLRKSGLRDETIAAAGIHTVRPEDLKRILPPAFFSKVENAYKIPYLEADGYVRYRLNPPIKTDDGTVKYFQQKGSACRLYFTQLALQSLARPEIPLAVVEGEKKALRLAQGGLSAIGIGGIWSWRQDGKTIDDFDRVDWCDRDVDLVPDSDVWTRPDLLKSVYALGRELEQRGARVQAVKLPHNEESKTGVDDYLLNNSMDDFGSLKRVGMKHAVFKLISVWWKDWTKETPPSLSEAGNTFLDPEPWAEKVDGLELFGDVKSLFSKYIVMSEHALIAMTLWVLHSWTLDSCYVSPIMAITSPTKRCGKTRTLELLSVTVRRAMIGSNITPAATFRAIDKFSPTILIDEADTFLANNDELRGVLNSSHYRPTAYVIRTAGDEHDPKQFSTWAAKAIASIGHMRDTLVDRSITVPLKRKTPGDKVTRLVHRELAATAAPLRQKLARWSSDVMAVLSNASPALPGKLDDRAADNWTPLLAIADLLNVGVEARAAALKLSGEGEDEAAATMLLEDIEAAFKELGDDTLFSQEIVDYLVAMEERPWPEWSKGKPITARKMASLLKPFDIRPKQVWKDGETKRGYANEQFEEAFSRYTSVRTVRTQSSQQLTAEIDPLEQATPNGSVSAVNDSKQSGLTVLTDRNSQNGETNNSDGDVEIVERRL